MRKDAYGLINNWLAVLLFDNHKVSTKGEINSKTNIALRSVWFDKGVRHGMHLSNEFGIHNHSIVIVL